MNILLAHTPSLRNNYYGDQAVAGLQALGSVKFHESETALSPVELIQAAKDVDVIVADRLTTVPKIVFDSLPNLKVVLRCAVDVRNIDITAASEQGILVTHAKPGFVESVSELVFGYLVDLSRGVSHYARAYHDGNPAPAKMGQQLSGSTLGIIGYGAIARHTSEIANILGMRVIVYDPYVDAVPSFASKVALEVLLKSADYVLCLAVATEETENLMNSDRFKLMKNSAFFINPSRGNLVDEAALLDVLQKKLIAGAALDVGRFPDQMPNPSIAALPNVIATPHIGGLTPPAILAQALDTVEQVKELSNGLIPHGSLNSNSWTRLIK